MRFVFIKGMLYVVFARIDRYLFRLVSRFIIHALPCLTLLVQSRLPFSNTTQHNTTNPSQLRSFMTLKGTNESLTDKQTERQQQRPGLAGLVSPAESRKERASGAAAARFMFVLLARGDGPTTNLP